MRTKEDYLRTICEYLTPSTLAAVVADLRNSPLHGARDVVRESLIANVGEKEAGELIWDADKIPARQHDHY